MSWNREEVTVLLEEYRKWPNLYKVKSVNYKNRNLRNRALESICSQLRPLKPEITAQEIQGKFQALKQNATKERKKFLESQKSGAGTDEIAEPSLWYYKLVAFVFDDQVPRESFDSLDNEEDLQVIFVEDDNSNAGEEILSAVVSPEGVLVEDLPVTETETPIDSESQSRASSRRLSSPGPSSRVTTPNPPLRLTTPGTSKKRKREDDDVVDVKNTLRSISKSLSATQEPLPRSKGQIFAEYLASKMDKIDDEDIRDETEAELISVVNTALRKCRNK